MSISSINSSSSAMMSGAMKRPDPTKMAEDLFSKLDTTGKGYIEKSDLQSALGNVSQSDSSSSSTSADDMFSKMDSDGNGKVTKEEMSATIQKIASELDGQSPRMRMQGDMPPPPPPGGAQGAQKSSSTDSSSSNQDIEPADANEDGTVSAKEAQAYAASQASSDTSSTSSADAQLMQMLAGGMPPPPQEGGQGDQGFTKDQLTSMSKDLSSTDSERSKVMSDVAANFDAADTNGDGKVSGSEARTFEDSKNASGSGSSTDTSSTSSASNADAQFMKQMVQLLKSYGFDQTAESSGFSTSA
ncbi:EF-hand domain-containing protein [Methylobacter tundripaludum]|uniref:EF hand repeat-containing protein n=1 Tax=Methylobacter tundripaludum (strain ATCC BAA-1195 / DSM 17260 / SV96) TaxID=697282 RepID=G3IZS8_METTV|nr:EF-hand domain-containing protein [Methylobacter tundripaludum]EGW20450.1 EF hand repeat-containing protein [Methylobacter tundripaludum SV96]